MSIACFGIGVSEKFAWAVTGEGGGGLFRRGSLDAGEAAGGSIEQVLRAGLCGWGRPGRAVMGPRRNGQGVEGTVWQLLK